MHDDDEDRAVILRRRQRFIAIALSGLTSAVGCDEPPVPAADPIEAAQIAEPADTLEGVEDEPHEPTEEPDPAPLHVPSEPDPAEVAHAEEQKRRQRRRPVTPPRVCLSRPRVCLSPISPMVCLFQKPSDPDDID